MCAPYFLGVDGGQSSTTAMIGDAQGCVIGMGTGGPCNHVGAAEGLSKFIHAIEGCVAAACVQANLDCAGVRFESACLGFSGGPEDKEAILREILSTNQMLVTNDALIALAGATAGEPGIIVIAGTGSIAFGRNREGAMARVGGWGYVFGDEGGGFDLTRQALRAALRFDEGWGDPTNLGELLLRETGTRDMHNLLHRFYTTEFSRPHIAALSKLVDRAAQEGDRVAQELLDYAAEKLADLAQAVRQILSANLPVAYIGGVFRSQRLLASFRERITPVHAPVFGPAAGALIEAYRASGVHVALLKVPETEK